MDGWHAIFNNINDKSLAVYLVIILFWYSSFLIGSTLGNRDIKIGLRLNLKFNKSILNIYYYFSLLLSIYFIYHFRNHFFRGYVSGIDNVAGKGPFIALSLVVLVLAIINASKILEIKGNTVSFKEIFLNKYFVFYYFLAFLILSLGGRLYFISSIFMLLVFYSVYIRKTKSLTVFIFLVLMFFSLGFIGVFRSGTKNISLIKMIFNVFQEPLYTSFSLISFLDINNFSAFNLPIYLFSSLLNLIPTFIMPNKLSYIKTISDSSYFIYNPLGAMSLFPSAIINFGYIGTGIFLLMLGYFLTKMKTKKNSILATTIYVSVSGFLTFTLFRDGFETSLIKNIFQFSILIPILVVFTLNIISLALSNYKNN